jgi:hypothetical protein
MRASAVAGTMSTAVTNPSWLRPWTMVPVPADPPPRNPPSVDCTVEGYIHSWWPCSWAWLSRVSMRAPASAVIVPFSGSSPWTVVREVMSSTSPPKRGRTCP